jgi:hypothetical protein
VSRAPVRRAAGGVSGPRAFKWTAANGALDLRDDLIANIGLGPELQG